VNKFTKSTFMMRKFTASGKWCSAFISNYHGRKMC